MDEAKATPRPVVRAVEAIGIVILFIGALAALYGLACVAEGLWGLFWHGTFDGEPMWQFLHLEEPHHQVLTWDRSIYLVFGGFAVCNLAMEVGDSLAGWLAKTPEQRALARAKSRELAQRSAKFEKEQREKAEGERVRKRGSRVPMSGWRRLWIVLSVLIGVPTFLIAYEDGSNGYAYITPDQEVRTLTGQQFWDGLFDQAKRERPDLRSCNPASVRMRHLYAWEYSIACDRNDALLPALLWSLLPAALMWIVGMTVGWVYRGFRPLPAPPSITTKQPGD